MHLTENFTLSLHFILFKVNYFCNMCTSCSQRTSYSMWCRLKLLDLWCSVCVDVGMLPLQVSSPHDWSVIFINYQISPQKDVCRCSRLASSSSLITVCVRSQICEFLPKTISEDVTRCTDVPLAEALSRSPHVFLYNFQS